MLKQMSPFGLLFLACAGAQAQDITPGLWRINVDSVIATTPGYSPPPVSQTQCLSAADARDPQRLFGDMAAPGAADCSYGKAKVSGSNLRFTMQCSGALNLHASGDVDLGAETMSGSISSSANLGGQQVDMQSKVSGKRIGAC
ncbi:MAG TPA: DUF3617 family protein [Burkholderiales bacterium]